MNGKPHGETQLNAPGGFGYDYDSSDLEEEAAKPEELREPDSEPTSDASSEFVELNMAEEDEDEEEEEMQINRKKSGDERTVTVLPPGLTEEDLAKHEGYHEPDEAPQQESSRKEQKFRFVLGINASPERGHDIEPNKAGKILIEKLDDLALNFFRDDDPDSYSITSNGKIHIPGDGENIERANKILGQLNRPDFEQRINYMWQVRQNIDTNTIKQQVQKEKDKIEKKVSDAKGAERKPRQKQKERMIENAESRLKNISLLIKERISLARQAIVFGQSLGLKTDSVEPTDEELKKILLLNPDLI